MKDKPRFAFYDFDGTLTRGNVVRRFAYLARRQPARGRAALKSVKLVLSVPLWIGLDLYSRRLFNEAFFREYRGFRKDWLWGQASSLFEDEVKPSLYPAAARLIERDRAAGFSPVLVSGELDFALEPVVRYLRFEGILCNSPEYENGVATGQVVRPLIAEGAKVEAMSRYCRERGGEMAEAKAYSDSLSDLPMLEAAGFPAAVNPGRRLRRLARQRGWPILDLRTEDVRSDNEHPTSSSAF
jgi:HAD superfamily hydrolase (TIGR01490 family)